MSNDFISGANTTIKIGSDIIGDIDSIGAFGGRVEVIRHTPINDGVVYKAAGSRDNGTLQLQGAYVPADVGQTALKAAFDARDTASFEIELGNAVTPTTGTGTTFAFTGLVTSFEVGANGPNDKISLSVGIEITGTITVTAAT